MAIVHYYERSLTRVHLLECFICGWGIKAARGRSFEGT